MPDDDDSLAARALSVLAELDAGNGISMARLSKRLGVRVSVLLREFTYLSDARIGDVQGPGLVQLRCDNDGRFIASITEAGRHELHR